MTIFFFALLGLCCLLALAQIHYAFGRAQATTAHTIEPDLKPWYQGQLQELNDQFARHEIDDSLYQQNRLALQREWLNSQITTTASGQRLAKPWPWLLGLLVVAIACGFYWRQGTASALLTHYRSQQQSQQAEQFLQTLGGPDQILAALKAQVEKHPDDAKGWYLLGRLYFNNNQFSAAIDALSRANRLSPDQADIILSLAEALYLSHQPAHQQQAQQLLTTLLQQQPQNPGALNLTALMAYQNHQYQRAIELWQSLWEQVPPTSDTAKALQQAIDKARHEQQLAQTS